METKNYDELEKQLDEILGDKKDEVCKNEYKGSYSGLGLWMYIKRLIIEIR